MKECIEDYLSSISSKFSHEETSEYGYRADFENLLNKLFESIKNLRIDHDPKAVEGNKPDFAVISGEAPLLYLEAKDIGISLDKIEKSDQMDRYFGYSNLVLTDYLEFRFTGTELGIANRLKLVNTILRSVLLPRNPKITNY